MDSLMDLVATLDIDIRHFPTSHTVLSGLLCVDEFSRGQVRCFVFYAYFVQHVTLAMSFE